MKLYAKPGWHVEDLWAKPYFSVEDGKGTLDAAIKRSAEGEGQRPGKMRVCIPYYVNYFLPHFLFPVRQSTL